MANSNSPNFDRRNVLKSIGIGGTISIIPGIAAADQQDIDNDVTIERIEPREEGRSVEDTEAIIDSEKITSLADSVEAETRLSRDLETPLSLELVTDNQKLNAAEPVITHIPFKPPNAEQFSPNNSGIIFAISIKEDGERNPIAAFAGARERTDGANVQSDLSLQSSEAGSQVRMTTFGQQNGRVRKINETTESAVGVSSDLQPKASFPEPSCTVCMTLVDSACVIGSGTLSYGACVDAVVATAALSGLGSLAVGALCTYLVSQTGVTCTVGTLAACTAVGWCDATQ
ncbi:hypothetical protein [Natrinema pallidum]|uniref:Uncharacterized protein n=1 Tax=Natrinema pallidum TaxID=69527 RepID=A0A4P9TIE1_9EURY|nr:hypothetical protein [Natrinema pallidum]QCW04721.1 hypothetical protein FGF80_16490 [Natrinema pallidum]